MKQIYLKKGGFTEKINHHVELDSIQQLKYHLISTCINIFLKTILTTEHNW